MADKIALCDLLKLLELGTLRWHVVRSFVPNIITMLHDFGILRLSSVHIG